MQISVKDLNGKSITLDVATSDTVANVKTLIQTQTGISPDLQVLLTGNTSLNASQPLSDYNIQQQSTLSLVTLPKTYTTTPSVGVLAIANGSEDQADTPIQFLFYRTGDTSQAATINYNLMGSAQSGNDYTGATQGSVSFAAGSNTTLLSLPVLRDSVIDPGESVRIGIQPLSAEMTLSGYRIQPGHQYASALINAESVIYALPVSDPSPIEMHINNGIAFAALKNDGSVVAWGDQSFGGQAPDNLTGVSQIFSNSSAFAALKNDGSVVAWGDQSFGGQAPNGLSGVSQIFSTNGAFAALKNDGSVVAWGNQSYGGQAPDNLTGVSQIFSSIGAFAALKNDGTVVAWGEKIFGGQAPDNLTGVSQIFSTSGAFAALKNDGTVVAWADDSVFAAMDQFYGGQAPENLTGVSQIFSNNYAFAALKNDGAVVAWGKQSNGGQAPDNLTGVSQIFSNARAFAALKTDGSVVAWGNQAYGGQAPDNLTGVSQIFSAFNTFAALKTDGSVVAWGDQAYGGQAPDNLTGVSQIFSTRGAFAALKNDGSVVAWGDQSFGGQAPDNLTGVSQIFSNNCAFAALKNDGSVVAWGNQSYGGQAPDGLTGVVAFANPATFDALLLTGNAAPTLTAPASINFADTPARDDFTSQSGLSGTMTATDAENDPLTFGISGGTNGVSYTSGGVTYDVFKDGIYSTLYVVSTGADAGKYVLMPNNKAINTSLISVNETYTVTTADESNMTTATLTVNVIGVNDAPTLTATTSTPTFTENGTAVSLFSNASVSTVEGEQNLKALVLTVTNVADTTERLGIDGTTVNLTAGASGTTSKLGIGYSVSMSGTTATITLSKTAGLSAPELQALVDELTYSNTSDSPAANTRVVTLTSLKDSGGDQDTATLNLASTVTITAVNDAPALNAEVSPAFTPISEDQTDGSNAGTMVATLVVDTSITDPDGSAVEAVAVSAADNTHGTWQYRVGDGSWTAFDFNNNSGKALLLDSSDSIRFVPNADWNGTVSHGITFYAWDKSSGSAGSYLAVSGNTGGINPLSTMSDTAAINVTAVNDAPVITAGGRLGAVNEDTNPFIAGAALSTLGIVANDTLDSGSIKGYAIVGNTANATTEGAWQYSPDYGIHWFAIGSVADDSALALSANMLGDTLVRFVPVANYNGTPGSLTLRALDNSYNAGFSLNVGTTEARFTLDTSSPSSTSAFSQITATLVTSVTAVNDSPTGNFIIKGIARQNETLSIDNTLQDVDGITQPVHYQWLADGAIITGATGTSLTLSEAQVGKTISVSASYTDADGTLEIVNSEATAAVANVNDLPTGAVTISGTLRQYETLTVSNNLADIDGIATPIGYQWQVNSVDIPGATSERYTLTEAEVGKTLTVVAHYTDGHGQVEPVSSPSTAPVANVNDAPVALQPATTVSLLQNQTTQFDLTTAFTDQDKGDQARLVYSLVNLPASGAAVVTSLKDNTLTLSNYASTAGQSIPVTLRATDPAGAYADTVFSVALAGKPTAPNRAPVLAASVLGEAGSIDTASATWQATLPENRSDLLQFKASDADGDRISYSLGGADAALFQLDSNGLLQALKPLDFESRTDYSLTVSADDGRGGLVTQAVNLQVSNVAEAVQWIHVPQGSATLTAHLIGTAAQTQFSDYFFNPEAGGGPIQWSVTPITPGIGGSASGNDFNISVPVTFGGLADFHLTAEANGVTTGFDVGVRFDRDNDGVDDVTEANANDRNGDGIPDNQQDAVASFPAVNGDTGNAASFFSLDSSTQVNAYLGRTALAAANPALAESIDIGDLSAEVKIERAVSLPVDIEAQQKMQAAMDALAKTTGQTIRDLNTDFGFVGFTLQPQISASDAVDTGSASQFADTVRTSFSQSQNMVRVVLPAGSDVNVYLKPVYADDGITVTDYQNFTLQTLDGKALSAPDSSQLITGTWFHDINGDGKADEAVLYFVDNQRGDDDPAAGIIRDPGAFAKLDLAPIKPSNTVHSSVTSQLGENDAHLVLEDAGSSTAHSSYVRHAKPVFKLAGELYPGWYMDMNHIKPDSLIQTSIVNIRELVTTYTFTYKVLKGTGNAWDNAITGSNGANILSGLDGNDTLTGLDGRDQLLGGSGDDVLEGGIGNDTLDGGTGTDVMTGGDGRDIFRFTTVGDSVAGLDHDTITDFSKDDRIDLRNIDANSDLKSNQAFRFIKDADFSGKAGELRFDTNANLLQGDVNGDSIPDVEILLAGLTSLSSYQIQL